MRQPKYFIQTQKGKLQLSKGSFITLKNKKNKMQKDSNSKSLNQSRKTYQSKNSSPIKNKQKTLVKPITRSCFITPKKIKSKSTFKQNLLHIYQDSEVFKNSRHFFRSLNEQTQLKNQDNTPFYQDLSDNIDFSIQKLTGNYKPSISKFESQLEQTQFKSLNQLTLTKDQISIQQLRSIKIQKERSNGKNRHIYYQENPQNMQIQIYDQHMEEQTTWNEIGQNIHNLSIEIAMTAMSYR